MSDGSDVEGGDEGGTGEESSDWFKPSYVIFAIDTHPSMFVKTEESKGTHFRNSLKACYSIADSLVIQTDERRWSKFAVTLAKEDPVLVEFQNNVIETTKLLKDLTKLSDTQLRDQYERKGDFDLAEFFLRCKKLFHDLKGQFNQRYLIYITNDDNPAKTRDQKFAALNEAKTFVASQISFQVIPSVHSFDYKLFYNELLSLSEAPSVEEICEDADGLTEKLLSLIFVRRTRRQAWLCIGENKEVIGCFVEKMCEACQLNFVNLTKDGKKIKRMKQSTEGTIYYLPCKQGMRSADLKFTREDNDGKLLDLFYLRGYTLLYISERVLDDGHLMGNPHFLSQNAEMESEHFKRLWQYCVNNDRVLICVQKTRNPGPLFYAQLSPIILGDVPGFACLKIPSAEEVISPAPMQVPPVEEDADKKRAIKKLVDDLTIDFDFQMIPDSAYRKRKAYLKAKLLDEPVPELKDGIFDERTLDDRLEDAVAGITSLFVDEAGSGKRGGSNSSGANKKRRRN